MGFGALALSDVLISEVFFLSWGRRPQAPGDLSRWCQNGCLACGAAYAAPSHSGRWVGAPVASLRSRILRPGQASINPLCRFFEKMFARTTSRKV
jgi:hypothetical protein